MTLPTTGPIAISNINTETGAPAGGFSSNMGWVKGNSKQTVGGSANVIDNLGGVRGLTYYQSNMAVVCNNGNQTLCNCNCGNIANGNCVNCTNINCTATNCSTGLDAQKYLQPNCNCNCTYNCNVSGGSRNCNCDCWVCACTW